MKNNALLAPPKTGDGPGYVLVENNETKTEKSDFASAPPNGRLSRGERALFNELKIIVSDGMTVLFSRTLEVGRALSEIKAKNLYRERHKTWEAFCLAEFNVARSRSYELMNAAAIGSALSATADIKISPTNERQIRPLATLKEPERREAAWRRALEIAGSEPVTEDIVKKAIKELAPAKPASLVPSINPQDDWRRGIVHDLTEQGFELPASQPFTWPIPVVDLVSKTGDHKVKLIDHLDLDQLGASMALRERHPDAVVVIDAYGHMTSEVEDVENGTLPYRFGPSFDLLARSINAVLEDEGQYYVA